MNCLHKRRESLNNSSALSISVATWLIDTTRQSAWSCPGCGPVEGECSTTSMFFVAVDPLPGCSDVTFSIFAMEPSLVLAGDADADADEDDEVETVVVGIDEDKPVKEDNEAGESASPPLPLPPPTAAAAAAAFIDTSEPLERGVGWEAVKDSCEMGSPIILNKG